MKDVVTGLLHQWASWGQGSPGVATAAGVAAAMFVLALLSRMARRIMQGDDDGFAPEPILVRAAFLVLGACLAWSLADVVLAVLPRPPLSEYVLRWLAPAPLLTGGQALSPVLLPGPVRITVGIALAGACYLGLAYVLRGTASELRSLHQEPPDVIAHRRAAHARAVEQALGEAREPPPAEPPTPLIDSATGRLYRWCGHFADVQTLEERFGRWHRGQLRWMWGLLALTTPAAVFGDLPVALWAGTAVLLLALRQNVKRDRPPAVASPPVPDAPEVTAASTLASPAAIQALLARPELAEALENLPPPQDAVFGEPAAFVRGRLGAEVLRGLGVDRLYRHQAVATRLAEEGRSVCLATAEGSGRQLALDLVVFATLLGQARCVLYVLPDREAARDRARAFARWADRTHWKWNMLSVVLGDPHPDVDPLHEQPTLVFADPIAVATELCRRPEQWSRFLRDLQIIAMTDVHRYSGVRGAHLSQILARLGRARSRVASLVSGEVLSAPREPVPPQFVMTAEPVHHRLGDFVERLVSEPVTVVGPDEDGAPMAWRQGLVMRPGTAESAEHPAVVMSRDARRLGLECELAGHDDVLTEAERDPRVSLASAHVVIERSSAPVAITTAHAGAQHRDAQATLEDALASAVLVMACLEPADTSASGQASRAPSAVMPRRAPAITRHHLRALLSEARCTVDELKRSFPADIVTDELDSARRSGLLREESRRVFEAGDDVFSDVALVSLRQHDLPGEAHIEVAGKPLRLVERRSNQTLAVVEACRGLLAAHPGHRFVSGSRRFVVLEQDAASVEQAHAILCELDPAPRFTRGLRDFDIELVERRRGDETLASSTNDRRASSRFLVAGRSFELQIRPAMVHERLEGYILYTLGGAERERHHFDEPLQASYVTMCAVLSGEAATDGLTQRVASALPAYLDAGPMDVAMHRDDRLGLVFIDLHQGGAGFVELRDILPELLADLT